MELVSNYLHVVKDNYLNFKGRARRREYWMFFLANFILGFILGFIFGLFGIGNIDTIMNLFTLAVFLPWLAVAIRRMHDVGKSGWFILVPIYNLVLLCTDSTPGENKYGPNPKGR